MRRLFFALACCTASAALPTVAHADTPQTSLQGTSDEADAPDDDTPESEPSDEGLSKKAAFLADKSERKDVRAEDTSRTQLANQKSLTLRNAKTQESIVVPLDARAIDANEQETFSRFLRCRFTNTAADMDTRLLSTLVQVARKFKTSVIEIVSGYRSPKFQLMLRKKGHEVARDSEHTRGNAVDFRIPAIKTRKLLAYVKSLRIGGVGYYPQSGFVHADVGRVRYWRGH